MESKRPVGRILLLIAGILMLVIGIPSIVMGVLFLLGYFLGISLLGGWLAELIPVYDGVVTGATSIVAFFVFSWVRGFVFLELIVSILVTIGGISAIRRHQNLKKSLRLVVFTGITALLIVLILSIGFSLIFLALPRLALLALALAGAVMNLISARKHSKSLDGFGGEGYN